MIEILPEAPDSPDSVSLIEELEAELEPLYPAKSRHGYSVEKLIRERVEFFVIRFDGVVTGCGGVQMFPPSRKHEEHYGEIKRMYVRPEFREKGLAKAMLQHLSDIAIAHGATVLRLETGIHQHDAIALYERMGFVRIGPFGEYWDDPLSGFYELRIGP